MKVGLYTPEGPLYEGEADRVAAISVEGAFEVLPGHAPLVAELVGGPLRLHTPQGEKTFTLSQGFLWVTPTGEVHIVGR